MSGDRHADSLCYALVEWIEETLGASVAELLLDHDASELPALAQEHELREAVRRYESLLERGLSGAEVKRAAAERARLLLTREACAARRRTWRELLR